MTWSAFMVAMRNGVQTRGNAVRQGANRATQQTQRPGATNQARAASSKVNKRVDNGNVPELRTGYVFSSIRGTNIAARNLSSQQHTGEPWMSQVLVHN
eukprot:scaffold2897_cov178-Amphora_coffeaeformis.AAC.21